MNIDQDGGNRQDDVRKFILEMEGISVEYCRCGARVISILCTSCHQDMPQEMSCCGISRK